MSARMDLEVNSAHFEAEERTRSMMWKNSASCYGIIARTLHWLMAVLLVGLFALGWYMTELTYYDPWYKDSFDLHKSFGLLAFILAFARLAWVLHDRPPALLKSMKDWEVLAAKSTHHMLYVLMVLIPISGYLISTADGHAIEVFGLFELPAIFPVVDNMEELAGQVHYYLAFGTAFLVLGHIGAALKHHFINRDRTLGRMFGGKHRGKNKD